MKTKTKATKKPRTTRLEAKIKKLNAAYKKASPAQRRVMIAKDALTQIKRGSITASRGIYVRLLTRPPSFGDPLQPVLLDEKDPSHCNCCAKGALFVSCVRLSNRFNGPPTDLGSADINRLVDWPEYNYDSIEAAFELYDDDEAGYRAGYRWVKKWRAAYPEGKTEQRLVGILKNIIRNKGNFRKHDV